VALTIRKLPVPDYAQEQGYYCGPACAQMILSYWGTALLQDTLWATIKAKTTGTRPTSAPATPGHFPSQQCDLCGVWHCWDTHPQALSAAISAHTSWFNAVSTSYPSTIDETILALIDSVDAVPSTPPCAAFYAINHWVVITGYHLDDPLLPGAAPYQVGSLQLNGIYFQNPNTADPAVTVDWLPTVQFRQSLGSITCGANLDRYPIVAANPWRFVYIWLLAFWYGAWRWWLRVWR